MVSFYRQTIALKLLPRTGWLQRGVAQPESIAEHSFGVALLALVVGDSIGGIDRTKLLATALLHDLAEVHLTDLPASASLFLGKHAKHAAEEQAFCALTAVLPCNQTYQNLWAEYVSGATVEARLVKALDRIEMLMQALVYEQFGNRGLDEFWEHAETGWEEFPLLAAVVQELLVHRTQSR